MVHSQSTEGNVELAVRTDALENNKNIVKGNTQESIQVSNETLNVLKASETSGCRSLHHQMWCLH